MILRVDTIRRLVLSMWSLYFQINLRLRRFFCPRDNKRCADLLQAKCDQLENQGVLVDPQHHGDSVVHVSPSWIQQKGRAKHKNLQDCKLDELRFITAFNALNDCIRPKPTTSCSATVIFMFLARWWWRIFGDLNNSYFQLPVRKRLWGYLGIQTPYKVVKVLTPSYRTRSSKIWCGVGWITQPCSWWRSIRGVLFRYTWWYNHRGQN